MKQEISRFFEKVTGGRESSGAHCKYTPTKLPPEKLEQLLGLPLISVAGEYDVFKITYVENDGSIFKSTVASTEQFANPSSVKYSTTGGGIQTLILDNLNSQKWRKGQSPIETIAPNQLPQIGN